MLLSLLEKNMYIVFTVHQDKGNSLVEAAAHIAFNESKGNQQGVKHFS
jgi:hypothetical protein